MVFLICFEVGEVGERISEGEREGGNRREKRDGQACFSNPGQ
jgi:hypothetical protein